MGKYSLENYEKYATTIVRPKLLKTTTETEQRTLVKIVELAWNEIEIEQGVYRLSYFTEMLQGSHQAVLMLNFSKPAWVTQQVREHAASFIRRVGSYIDGATYLNGVIINSAENSLEEWCAYADAFKATTLYIDLHKINELHYFERTNKNIGMLIRAAEDNYISCCEQFAEHKLNHFWSIHPILLDVQDVHCGPILQREAQRWHVSYSTKPNTFGYHFELRRLTFPQKAGIEGHLPLRFWFVNVGTAKVYESFMLKVKLSSADDNYEFTLDAPTSGWLTGDLVHNELIKLPKMKQGTYQLYAGLFFKDGRFIALNIENEQKQGYYELGEIELEQWGDDPFATIWESYYPEGYYPLEDPALPAEQ